MHTYTHSRIRTQGLHGGYNGYEIDGHLLVRSLVPSHRSLIRLLRTASFARVLRCAHSFAPLRSFARSLTRSRAHGKEVFVYEVNASISYSFNPLRMAWQRGQENERNNASSLL